MRFYIWPLEFGEECCLFLEILDLEGLCDTFCAYRDPVVAAQDVISPVQHLQVKKLTGRQRINYP
jgi:hypothetical protein